jgi:hypothetical protein
MLMHPDLMMALADDHRRELIAEADRSRLLAAARDRRARKTPAARPPRTGVLNPRHPSAAVPAR